MSVAYGRGGAGNRVASPKIAPAVGTVPVPDFSTPTIKAKTYTTGRGGQGNMMTNDPSNPEKARRAQDVAPIIRRTSGGESHFGRGGAANTFKLNQAELETARRENAILEEDAVARVIIGREADARASTKRANSTTSVGSAGSTRRSSGEERPGSADKEKKKAGLSPNLLAQKVKEKVDSGLSSLGAGLRRNS